jgi:transposase-like protein
MLTKTFIQQHEDTPLMSKHNIFEFKDRDTFSDALTEMPRTGSQQLIHQAVKIELEELLAANAHRLTADGNAAVVRNGYQPQREILTGIGPVTVKLPKVRSKDGEAVCFHSSLVPQYVRRSRSLEAALPWLYLKGVSTGEMGEALKLLVGPDTHGLSASTVARLKQVWAQEYQHWNGRRLDQNKWMYIWADGIYSGLRAEQTELCALVIVVVKGVEFKDGIEVQSDNQVAA